MLTVRYWTASQFAAPSPFGDATSVLTEEHASEQALRSVATWCGLNKLAYRVGVCGDPRSRAQQLESSLVEVERSVDGDLLHAVYVRKPWNYMHVLHRTVDSTRAGQLMRRFVGIGKGLGRCENSERDLLDAMRQPPYFVYILTGHLPSKLNVSPATPQSSAAPSLLGLAGG